MNGGSTIVRALEQWAGLDAQALGPSSVSDAVSRHAKGPGEDEEAFAARLARDVAARARWLEDLLVHETSFFRYPASFDLLSRHLMARAARSAGVVRIRSDQARGLADRRYRRFQGAEVRRQIRRHQLPRRW